MECTHTYNKSHYYAGDDKTIRMWEGYDAYAQTEDAQDYIRRHAKGEKPFLLMVAYGGPHFPHATAPEELKELCRPCSQRECVDARYASYLFKSSRMIYLLWAYSYGITGDRLRLYYPDFARIAFSKSCIRRHLLSLSGEIANPQMSQHCRSQGAPVVGVTSGLGITS